MLLLVGIDEEVRCSCGNFSPLVTGVIFNKTRVRHRSSAFSDKILKKMAYLAKTKNLREHRPI